MAIVIIPETITVHLGPPKSEAENVTVSFVDYIKNVASSEIYPTWPESAIRANVYAQITFALNRVFTEWYRSQGYNFDITNSTQCDQAFEFGRDIFGKVNQIVDQIFDEYVRRIGNIEPLFTQYCDGRNVTCDGLSQWGTVDLANNGLVPYEILQNYYGSDIEIVRTAPIVANMDSYPGSPIGIGSVGRPVSIIQTSLNRISANYPLIPKVTVDARYGEQTAEAVRVYQGIFDLEQTGEVNKETWYSLVRIYVSVKRLAELNSEGLKLADVAKQYPQPLSVGSRGQNVRVMQFFLSYVAAFNDFIPTVAIDGIFGEKTRDAVIAFQKNYNLEPTGIVDEQTWNRLYLGYRAIESQIPIDIAYPITMVYPGSPLKQGMSGEAVRAIQEYLTFIALYFRAIPAVTPTGYFGPNTTNAVRRFQNEFGLKIDGIIGEETWDEITEVYTDLKAEELRRSDQAPTYTLTREE